MSVYMPAEQWMQKIIDKLHKCVLVRIWSMMQREVSPIELSEQGLKSKGLYRCRES